MGVVGGLAAAVTYTFEWLIATASTVMVANYYLVGQMFVSLQELLRLLCQIAESARVVAVIVFQDFSYFLTDITGGIASVVQLCIDLLNGSVFWLHDVVDFAWSLLERFFLLCTNCSEVALWYVTMLRTVLWRLTCLFFSGVWILLQLGPNLLVMLIRGTVSCVQYVLNSVVGTVTGCARSLKNVAVSIENKISMIGSIPADVYFKLAYVFLVYVLLACFLYLLKTSRPERMAGLPVRPTAVRGAMEHIQRHVCHWWDEVVASFAFLRQDHRRRMAVAEAEPEPGPAWEASDDQDSRADKDSCPYYLERLEEQLERERDSQLCVICRDKPKCFMLLPCRHLCLCPDCRYVIVSRQRNCPVCRSIILDSLRVFT